MFTVLHLFNNNPFQFQGKVGIKKLEKLEELHKFNAIKNCEIKLQWLLLCLINQLKSSIEVAIAFVNAQGRMKFVRPIYRLVSSILISYHKIKLNIQKFKIAKMILINIFILYLIYLEAINVKSCELFTIMFTMSTM